MSRLDHPDLAGRGLIIAAPCSGSGKTLITLGLLKLFSRVGVDIRSAKAGPDYIDPKFHQRSSGSPCVNLDPWAMRPILLQKLAAQRSSGGPLLIEGMMGLFDGAADGSGSVADLAALLKLPVLLIVDASKQSHSIAALVEGFSNHRRDVKIAGVILNKVGSSRHEAMLRKALDFVPVIGAVRRLAGLSMPERHLGLVQAEEYRDLEEFIDHAADIMEQSLDLEALAALFAPIGSDPLQQCSQFKPLGQVIAVARDEAFAFSYPHLLDGWCGQGASIRLFSPLQDEAPDEGADAVYLPGGYPELHAGRIASNANFLDTLTDHASRGSVVFGECGGYMALGDGLVDGQGDRHKMAGLLPLVTSFEKPRLQLGYRLAKPLCDLPFASKNSSFSAHEFHYASVISEGAASPLFSLSNALGENLGEAGLKQDNVMGSFIHLIDMGG